MAQFVSFVVLILILFYTGTRAVQAPVKLLNDGNKIPILALGTYGSREDISRMRQAVYWAIETGYRHIDTAEIYGNELEIGQGIADAIQKGLVTREELFITTKLWNNHHARDKVIPALRDSLKRLGLNYVDLYLIHTPIAQKDDNTFENIDYLDTWRGLEDAKKLGLAKSIGVSNFNSEQIGRIIKNCDIKPAVNEIEIDRGTIPIPKSTNKERIIQNIEIFDFSLTEDEIASINKCNKDIRVIDVIEWKDNPYYPFNKA